MKNTESLNDEIKQERERLLEGKSTGYKIKYYVYYYKWYVIVAVAAIALIVSVIHSIRSNKESALSIALIDGDYEADYDAFMDEYEQLAGVDEKHEMNIDASYAISLDGTGAYDLQAQEKLFLVIATNQLDVIIAPEPVFKGLADLGYMLDLREVLSEEELAGCDIFMGSVADDSVEAVDDPDAPRHEEMSGINITDYPVVKQQGWYDDLDTPVYLGFVAGGPNIENGADFMHYLKQ